MFLRESGVLLEQVLCVALKERLCIACSAWSLFSVYIPVFLIRAGGNPVFCVRRS